MTKHAAEAIFIGLALLGLVPVAQSLAPPKREHSLVLGILATIAFVIGLILVINAK